jgi:hypothetical protein
VLRVVDNPWLSEVNVNRSAACQLAWDVQRIERELPARVDEFRRLKEANFRSALFSAPAAIDAEIE